ncbi:MAG: metal ABC transporter substrate-binding protein [Rubrobacter sp.]
MKRRKFPVISALVVASAAMAAAGCGGTQAGSSDESGEGNGGGQGSGGGVGVVASTTQIADLARNVGGDAIEEHQILQPNSDPHDYEPRPEDVRQTAGAALVFMNGDDLDPWVENVVSESGSEADVINLAETVPDRLEGAESDHGDEAHSDEEGAEGDAHSDEEHADEEGTEEAHAEEEHSDEAHAEEGDSHESEYDPHWWHDPNNAGAAVEQIRDSLIEADPENEQVYCDNAEEYLGQIQTLDDEIEACIAGVPEDQRKLVSDHEAFGYFTDRYDIEFVGAAIPSQSTQGQASAGETAELISLIEEENVQAVFPESSINASLAETIAEETGATSEYTLYGDALGPDGSDGDTYLKMMSANADALVRGFTGGEESCETSVGN